MPLSSSTYMGECHTATVQQCYMPEQWRNFEGGGQAGSGDTCRRWYFAEGQKYYFAPTRLKYEIF